MISIGFAVVLSQVPVWGQCTTLPGDANHNRHVELADYASFENCMAGPLVAPDPDPPQTSQSCLEEFDQAGANDVDLLDFAVFQTDFTGSIRPECFNVVFVSSATYLSNLGSAFAYDIQCNMLATAAGLNNLTNNAFIAWISTSTSHARARLGTARGFVRPDGVPVADTITSLLDSNQIWNPIRIDEWGNDLGSVYPMTGTLSNGMAALANCSNWTSTSGSVQMAVGSAARGPVHWTNYVGAPPCNQGPLPIYCIQKTANRPLALLPERGKYIYVTSTNFVPGSGRSGADDLCNAQKPAGAGQVRALLATTTLKASSLVDHFGTYIRVDGQVVGTGAELMTTGWLRSGIWQTGAGAYVAPFMAWTGSVDMTTLGTATGTCGNWTQGNVSGIVGFPTQTEAPKWWNAGTTPCSGTLPLYCIEQ
jgi:hypothetical protein